MTRLSARALTPRGLYDWGITRDGSRVTSQPDGAATWFPTSVHLSDKATHDFAVTVPEGLVAVANLRWTGEMMTFYEDLFGPYPSSPTV